MKKIFSLIIIGIFLLAGYSYSQSAMVQYANTKPVTFKIVSGGKSDYRIAIDAGASESENWAAKELQHWLKEIAGVEIPVQDITQQHNGPQIIIGYNEIVKQKSGATAPALLDESFRYVSSGSDLLIFGGKQRGTMYGVMAFLENELGCRWYTPSVSVIPKKEEIILGTLDHSEAPGIRVRNDFYFEAFDSLWSARNRMNGKMNTKQQPGGIESYWAVHTFFPLVPPEEYYKKHPEYYSLINGKRVHDHAQLCLTNPNVLKVLTNNLRKVMTENPEYLIYDVSQNDWANPCQCDKCQAIVKREGSESGVVIWFVNQVAEALEKEFPDKYIGTLAYKYTRKPCKSMKPRKNVVVRLCSIECCFAHEITSCPRNQEFLEDLKGWAAIAPNMYIWDYVVYFQHYIMPYPNIMVLQPNIKIFRENNAIGIMEQAAYESRGGEFAELRSYVISRLLWNPDADVKDLISDFMYGFYGRSGKYIQQYFDLLYSRVTPETHLHIESHKYNQLTAQDPLFSDEFVIKSLDIFDKAAKVAENEDIRRRVEMTSLPILYLKCKRTPVIARNDGTYEKFTSIAKREGVTKYAEYGSTVASFNTEVENAR